MGNFDEHPLVDDRQLDQLRELDDGTGSLFGELINMWEKTADQVFADMETAFADKNIKDLESLSHKFKGSCSNIGAKRLSVICELMEDKAAEGKYDGLEELWAEVKQLYPTSKEELLTVLGVNKAA